LRDPVLPASRFERYGDVYGTTLLWAAHRVHPGKKAISGTVRPAAMPSKAGGQQCAQAAGAPVAWPNRNGRRSQGPPPVVGQPVRRVCSLSGYSPAIVALVDDLQNNEL